MAAVIVRLALRAPTAPPLGRMPSSRLVRRATGHHAALSTAAALRPARPPVLAGPLWAAPRPPAPSPLVVPGAAARLSARRFASPPTKVCARYIS